MEVKGRKGTESFVVDEAPRPETTVETLARLKPAFRPDGTITAGNAPGLNSAASAMIVAERGFAEAKGIEPVARLAGYGVAAVEPGLFGLGPVPAVRKALDRVGWTLPTSNASRSMKPSPPCRSLLSANSACRRISSMSKAAPSRTAIRSALREQS